LSNLSISQIAALAQNAGFQGDDLATAVAVALAESGGNPNAVGDLNITAGGSVGLWQINLAYHPEFNGWNLQDPQTNANAAFSVYSAAGDSFTPWSTYKSEAYLAPLAEVEVALAASSAEQAVAENAGDESGGSNGPDQGTILALVVGGGLIFFVLSRYL
jgi:hypothetical protein